MAETDNDLKQDSVDTITINDALWERLIELTDGAASLCFQCGVCTATCPWGLVRDGTLSIRDFIRQAQVGFDQGDHGIWLCSTCGQCEDKCPRGVSISTVMRGLRYLAWEKHQTPEGLPSVMWSVHWNNNPWFQPPSQRANWSQSLDLPDFDADKHEILYYVGCTASYDRRAQQIARAMIQVFTTAGVQFGTLGENEPCCGEAVLNLGHKPYFYEIVEQTSRYLAERGVVNMVTTSPHSYDVFVSHYPSLSSEIQVQHYTQYLASLINEKRLNLTRSFDKKVTFQDPCYLARHHKEVTAPRQILNTIPGLQFIEMEHNQEDTICCGGGGGRMWMETEAGERFSDLRIEELQKTGAQVLATACPYCIACLEDSIKAKSILDVKVMDIVEIVSASLTGDSEKNE